MHLSSSIFTTVSKTWAPKTVLAIVKHSEAGLKPRLAQIGKTTISQYILHDLQLGKRWDNPRV